MGAGAGGCTGGGATGCAGAAATGWAGIPTVPGIGELPGGITAVIGDPGGPGTTVPGTSEPAWGAAGATAGGAVSGSAACPMVGGGPVSPTFCWVPM